MPYTPPSHRSPASSASTSPDVSRRSSIQHAGSPRPSLPHSSSYLNKHRRTPSVSSITDGVSEEFKGVASTLSNSVRQSPPPRTNGRTIPNGAVISPPESASSGSDDEESLEIRGRKLQKLKTAVSQISQPPTPSPRAHNSALKGATDEISNPGGLKISFSTTALSDNSANGRSRGHVRSATEPNANILQTSENSVTVSEEDTDEEAKFKPHMVRKKSGELVRPALRPASRRRPLSMPGTPIFSKAVHFDSHLEHVRHFLQVDRPLAVSAGSSPVENYDSDTEYPFPSENCPTGSRSPPFEWELLTPNFPHDSTARKSLPARLEKVWLSSDQKSLLGSVAVANLAFQKSITCRFTMDFWKTTSEVVAEYSHEIRPRETPLGHDRFTFAIKLSDMANLESKTLFFCIRYSVNGQEFWDNNSSTNFQIDFNKKHLPQNGKKSFQGASSKSTNGLPRSNQRRPNAGSALRPVSMPASLDAFDDDVKLDFDQPIHEYLGESGPTPLRLKTRSSTNLASDNIAKSVTSPSGVAFANRYDFSASLTAAVQAAKDSDTLYMKDYGRGASFAPAPATQKPVVPAFTPTAAPSGNGSPSLGLPSASYEELVNKYCFFGSKQSSPTLKDGALGNGGLDRTSGGHEHQNRTRSAGPAARHATQTHFGASSPPSGATAVAVTSLPLFQPYATVNDLGSTTPKSSGSVRSVSPGFPTIAGAVSSEIALEQQQMSPERFPWCGDAPTATAIRG